MPPSGIRYKRTRFPFPVDNLHETESMITAKLQQSVMQRQTNKTCFFKNTSSPKEEDNLCAGAIFLDDPVHAGTMGDVSQRVACEVPHTAVARLFIEPVRAAVA